MHRFVAAAFAAAMVAVWDPTGIAAQAGVLYGLVRPGGDATSLVILDPVGLGVVSGLMVGSDVTGITISPGIGLTPRGEIIGATGPQAPNLGLIRIDKSTGATTFVGAFNAGGKTMTAIAFGPSGGLYGWLDSNDGDLYSIDQATGAATLVGESGLDLPVTGLAIDPNGHIYVSVCCNPSDLRVIDPQTGAASPFIAYDPDGTAILALAFDSAGALFGISPSGGDAGSRDVVSIDPATGEVTPRAHTTDNLRSLVFDDFAVAEPSPFALLLLGGAWLCAANRKRAARSASLRPAPGR